MRLNSFFNDNFVEEVIEEVSLSAMFGLFSRKIENMWNCFSNFFSHDLSGFNLILHLTPV